MRPGDGNNFVGHRAPGDHFGLLPIATGRQNHWHPVPATQVIVAGGHSRCRHLRSVSRSAGAGDCQSRKKCAARHGCHTHRQCGCAEGRCFYIGRQAPARCRGSDGLASRVCVRHLIKGIFGGERAQKRGQRVVQPGAPRGSDRRSNQLGLECGRNTADIAAADQTAVHLATKIDSCCGYASFNIDLRQTHHPQSSQKSGRNCCMLLHLKIIFRKN